MAVGYILWRFNSPAIFTIFLQSSPPEVCPAGRTGDIDAILSTIAEAEQFVYIAVMDYLPITIYTKTPE